MATFLVTGGAGYIGSHLCKLLAANGHTPVTYDNLSRGHAWAVKWGPLEQGDLENGAQLRRVIEHWRPDGVFHFAAFAYVGESVDDPASYYRNNVAGTLSLLEAMRDQKIDRLVFSSTCATYGIPDRLPIRESDPQRPINPYGAGKLMIERMLEDFVAAYRLRVSIVRYFNAAGADPDGEIGECHEPEPHLIPQAILSALGKVPALKLFGTDYDTPDGSAIRDYVHVCDLAAAHLAAMARLGERQEITACNLGTGKGTSVLEIIAAVERIGGRPIPILPHPRRVGDPPSLVADARLAAELLGWSPIRSDLDSIVASAWQWHTSRKN